MKTFKVGICINSNPRPCPYAVYTYKATDKEDAKRQALATCNSLMSRFTINTFTISKGGPKEVV